MNRKERKSIGLALTSRYHLSRLYSLQATMITCGRCGITQAVENFNWKNRAKGKRQTTCRICTKEVRRDWYDSHKETHIATVKRTQKIRKRIAQEFVNALKESTPCTDCGIKYPSYVMDFDHLRNKEDDIANMVHDGVPLKRIQVEIDKCEIVCSNCHRIRTHMRRNTPVSELPPKQ